MAECDHTTVWHYHLEPLVPPKNEAERAALAALYVQPGGADLSSLVAHFLQDITCSAGTPAVPPTLSTVTPNTGTQGTVVTVDITGTGFITDATTVEVSGTGVVVGNIHVLSGGTLRADIAIAALATAGARALTVRNAGGSSSSQPFTVTGPNPPLSQVQVTTQASAVNTGTVSVTFASPPTPGNGIVVVVLRNNVEAADTATDNYGNTYSVAKHQTTPSGGFAVSVLYCPALASTGPGFTVTATGVNPRFRLAVAYEVAGPLTIDQTSGAEAAGVSATAGPTAALTGSTSFQVAGICVASAALASLTVSVATPVWTQDGELLSSNLTGEINSRRVTAAAGTTPSATWNWSGAAFAGFALVAFK